MKKLSSLKKNVLISILPVFVFYSCAFRSTSSITKNENLRTDSIQIVPVITTSVTTVENQIKRKIKIALLLDTSNSMDGLIDQARAQLWKLVNELSLAHYGDEKPELEIALYEYGNDGLSSSEGFIRQVSSFTGDLDDISEKLFGLKTNGGSEFCGQVISIASQQLEWKKDTVDLQLMFIAGNESFYQGGVNSTEACNTAKEKDIIVNTIFCGNYGEGINLGWKNGAIQTAGNYMSIEQDKKTVYIETPYDNELAKLNDQLNATYISYGYIGYEKKQKQVTQDQNAAKYGSANTANRVVSKTSKFYSNSSWDLVDASKQKTFDVTKVKETELPAELKGKTLEQKKEYIALKAKEREQVVKKIEELNVQRQTFIAEKMKSMNTQDNSLDAAMIKAIHEQAARKHFTFDI